MSSVNKAINTIDWFDLSSARVFMTPEMISGRPCVLLLDEMGTFKTHHTLKGKLEANGFERVVFEDQPDAPDCLYVLFAETLSAEFFYKDLRIPNHTLKRFKGTLLDIQSTFYEIAKSIFGFRVDVVVKSSLLLGLNHQNHEVYSSMFGRYKISPTGSDKKTLIYSIEPTSESNLSFLRAVSDKDALYCCEGYVKAAIANRRNISLNDAMKFASILFQPKGTLSFDGKIHTYQLLAVLNVFYALYTKNILSTKRDLLESSEFFSNRDIYKEICLNSESCPSPPRAIYTDFLVNQYSTPSPIAFVMQKLLVEGDDYTEDGAKSILNPMFGYGSLTNFLCARGYSVTGIENNQRKVEINKGMKHENLKLHHADCLNTDLMDYSIDDSLWRYVICNPSCERSTSRIEFSDKAGEPIVLSRTDLIAIMKSLCARKPAGRSVVLIPYYIDNDQDVFRTQSTDLTNFLNFIQSRYVIEGAALISPELYSKSLRKISPILLVIGPKLNSYDQNYTFTLARIHQTLISDFESLWDWASFITYNRSSEAISDNELFEFVLQSHGVITEQFIEETSDLDFSKSAPVNTAPNSPMKSIENSDDLFKENNADLNSSEQEDHNTTDSIVATEGEDSVEEPESGEETKLDGVTNSSSESNSDSETESLNKTELANETSKVEDSSTVVDKDSENANTDNNTGDSVSENKTSPHDEKANGETDDKNDKDSEIKKSWFEKYGTKSNKITKSKGNLFEQSSLNQIIRYHSVATLSEPTANVHQGEYNAYLAAKVNLSQVITDSFSQMNQLHPEQSKKLESYLEEHNIDVSVEAYIGAHLSLPNPRLLSTKLKSEHLDLISAGIYKFLNSESLLTLDSVGMQTDVAAVSLMHFSRCNGKGAIYIAKDTSAIDSLINCYKKLSSEVFFNKPPEFIILSDSSKFIEAFERFDKDTVVVFIDDILLIQRLKNLSIPIPPASNFNLIMDTDMGGQKYNSKFISDVLKAPTLFRSTRFIHQETNLQNLYTLFPSNIFQRYFSPSVSKFDDMSAYLLKLNLIKDLSLFQRFEDLSHIKLSVSDTSKIWGGKYEILSQSFSNTINNIVLLGEDIYRNNTSKAHQVKFLRETAIKIYELCMFCTTSVTLTYSIFDAVNRSIKPVIAIPKNIESTLFNILENLDLTLLENPVYPSISTLLDLNIVISEKELALEKLNGNFEGEYQEILTDYNSLILWRSASVFNYLTQQKSGTLSRYPDVSGLISIFFLSCLKDLNPSNPKYESIKKRASKIESDINQLTDLPICIVDFIKYELAQYQIRCGEISSRSLAMNFDESNNCWVTPFTCPMVAKYAIMQSNVDIAEGFNSGDYDVLFVEASELDGLDLSSTVSSSFRATLDAYRTRSLFITYFNMPIEHYLDLIHIVNNENQKVAPQIHLEVADTPVQTALSNLVIQQLGLYNIGTNQNSILDLSYYLTADGLKLLHEYLNLNPSYQAHYPYLPISSWNIYTVMSVANMTSSSMQSNIIEHLCYFSRQNLEFLKDIKANPFDAFTIAPKAKISEYKLNPDITYLNKKITNTNSEFSKLIKCASLSYVKESVDSFSLEEIIHIHKSQSTIEQSRIKSLLISQFGDNSSDAGELTHAKYLAKYIANLSSYTISVFRDKVINYLTDRYRNWVYINPKKVSNLNFIKNHFMSDGVLKVSSTLDDLYVEILMLGDLEIVQAFEDALDVLTFLRIYQTTLANQERYSRPSPIMLPIPSPFNDKTKQVDEGFLIKVNYPSSLMISLSAKSYTVSMAYPTKSKPTELTLAYILSNPNVLKNQNILSKISDRKREIILSAYGNNKFRDMLNTRILNQVRFKPSEFTDLNKLSGSDSHNTIKAFKTNTVTKIREMDIVYGNLFEAYFFLKDQIPLTMVSFVNTKGLTEHGFVIPADSNINSINEGLIRISSVSHVANTLKHFFDNQTSFKYLRSIKWIGQNGQAEVCYLNQSICELVFRGTENQIENILFDKDLFEDYPSSNDDLVSSGRSKKSKFKFTKLRVLDCEITHKGAMHEYRFKLNRASLIDLCNLFDKKGLYSAALIDCDQPSIRRLIAFAIQSQ